MILSDTRGRAAKHTAAHNQASAGPQITAQSLSGWQLHQRRRAHMNARTHARAHAHTQHRYMHSKLLVQAARAGLIVSPAASKIGNFNGVSTAVVVPPAPQSNLLSGRGGGALPLVSHNVRGYFIKDGGTDPPACCVKGGRSAEFFKFINSSSTTFFLFFHSRKTPVKLQQLVTWAI